MSLSLHKLAFLSQYSDCSHHNDHAARCKVHVRILTDAPQTRPDKLWAHLASYLMDICPLRSCYLLVFILHRVLSFSVRLSISEFRGLCVCCDKTVCSGTGPCLLWHKIVCLLCHRTVSVVTKECVSVVAQDLCLL